MARSIEELLQIHRQSEERITELEQLAQAGQLKTKEEIQAEVERLNRRLNETQQTRKRVIEQFDEQISNLQREMESLREAIA